ncbi:hypothetical protein NHX12_031372, partial [Muraenolepis orangiensis]
SYEHSGEIELARLNSNCERSFGLYASYELGDFSNIDLRERKNRRPVSHKPSPLLGNQSSVSRVEDLLISDLWFSFQTLRTVADVFDDDKK